MNKPNSGHSDGHRDKVVTIVTRRLAGAALVLAVAAGTAQCGTSPSGNPFGSCPAGMHRIRDVTQPPAKQWTCVQ